MTHCFPYQIKSNNDIHWREKQLNGFRLEILECRASLENVGFLFSLIEMHDINKSFLEQRCLFFDRNYFSGNLNSTDILKLILICIEICLKISSFSNNFQLNFNSNSNWVRTFICFWPKINTRKILDIISFNNSWCFESSKNHKRIGKTSMT